MGKEEQRFNVKEIPFYYLSLSSIARKLTQLDIPFPYCHGNSQHSNVHDL